MTLRNEPHDGYEGEAGAGPAVIVRFKSSSQPKGQDGYEVAVTSAATPADINRTILLAATAREEARRVLEGTYDGEARSIEVRDFGTLESFEAVNTAAEPRTLWRRVHNQAVTDAGVHVDADCPYCSAPAETASVRLLREALGEQRRQDAAEGAYERTMMQDQRA